MDANILQLLLSHWEQPDFVSEGQESVISSSHFFFFNTWMERSIFQRSEEITSSTAAGSSYTSGGRSPPNLLDWETGRAAGDP